MNDTQKMPTHGQEVIVVMKDGEESYGIWNSMAFGNEGAFSVGGSLFTPSRIASWRPIGKCSSQVRGESE